MLDAGKGFAPRLLLSVITPLGDGKSELQPSSFVAAFLFRIVTSTEIMALWNIDCLVAEECLGPDSDSFTLLHSWHIFVIIPGFGKDFWDVRAVASSMLPSSWLSLLPKGSELKQVSLYHYNEQEAYLNHKHLMYQLCNYVAFWRADVAACKACQKIHVSSSWSWKVGILSQFIRANADNHNSSFLVALQACHALNWWARSFIEKIAWLYNRLHHFDKNLSVTHKLWCIQCIIVKLL